MTTTWELIAADTYASEDWRYVIERQGEEWLIKDRGSVISSRSSLENAKRFVGGDTWVR